MLAIAAVIIAARIVGSLVGRFGQPPVMGEVLAGVLLGPSLLGWLFPSATAYLFPSDIRPLLSAAANIGLAFFMFLVGAELDTSLLKGRLRSAAIISNVSVVLPFAMGIGAGLVLYSHVGLHELIHAPPPVSKLGFVLFLGVAMAVTAFPVLSRILVERRMTQHPVGVMSLAAAAVDDVTAWSLLAVAAGVSSHSGGLSAVKIVVATLCLAAVIAAVGRFLLRRVATAFDEAKHIPVGWIAGIFVAVAVAAFTAAAIGISPILGAFMVGLAMPRRADLTADIAVRMHDFITIVLLPLFFVTTGLNVDIRGLTAGGLWLIVAALLAIAVIGKFGGATIASRLTGMPWNQAAAMGILMNTRGLTELIVLNIGRELNVIPPPLFTILVIVALVTTFSAAPALRLVDPRGEMRREPDLLTGSAALGGAVLVAPLHRQSTTALTRLAALLAVSPPREVILAHVISPARGAPGPLVDQRTLEEATQQLAEEQERLSGLGVASRSVAFLSPNAADDIVRLTERQDVDLALLDGRRALFGGGPFGGAIGRIFDRAPCDVAVLVDREGDVSIAPARPVLVPFGGSDHDWAALELGAWISHAAKAPLRIMGVAADSDNRDASRLLADASLVVQQMAGVRAEPLLVDRHGGVVQAAAGGGLVIVGLPEDWRARGLGDVRAELARAEAPTLFVRRGRRTGALAPSESMTRFTWSSYSTPVPGPIAGATT